jgi:uncharacterized membrane protein YphA (DoxX/SURF4 family)
MLRSVILALTFIVAATFLPAGVIHIYSPEAGKDFISPFLHPSSFRNVLFPGILAAVTGAVNLVAFLLVLSSGKYRYRTTVLAGFALVLWVLLEFILSGTYHWMQMFYLLIGLFLMLLGLQKMGKAVV